MDTIARPAASEAYLRVGDGRRPRLGRVVIGSLLLAGAFEVFVFGVKEVPFLGRHAPWADDPFDVVTSFAIFFVPLIAAVGALRLPLCRRAEPLPVSRVNDLMRAVRLLVVVMGITLVSDWTAVVSGADGPSWSRITPILVIGLLVLTAPLALVVAQVMAVGRRLPRDGLRETTTSDWIGDAAQLMERGARWLRLPPTAVARTVHWLDGVTTAIRARPLGAAALLAGAFAAFIVASAVAEGGPGWVPVLFAVVAWCGMFAFLAAGGAYLGLVRRSTPAPRGVLRRVVDALVLAGASVPLALGFRDNLWSIVVGHSASPGLRQVALMLVIAAVATFGLTLVTETVAGSHPDQP